MDYSNPACFNIVRAAPKGKSFLGVGPQLVFALWVKKYMMTTFYTIKHKTSILKYRYNIV